MVGWCTCQYPLVVEARGAGVGGVLVGVRRALAGVPDGGLGFGLLRWGHPNPAVRERLAAVESPVIAFNYLGQYDSVLSGRGLQLAKEPKGMERHPEGERTAVWHISGAILNGALQLEVEYSRGLHRRPTVQAFARRMKMALLDLIAIDLGSLESESLTPDEFPDVDLSQEDLDLLLEEIGEMGEG
jgi:non-ribosomal peptide synthase protein (TIGR01720 family)